MWDYLGVLTVLVAYPSALLALESIACSWIPAGIKRGHAFRPSPVEMRKPYGISGGFVLPWALKQVRGLVPCRRGAAEQFLVCIPSSTPVS